MRGYAQLIRTYVLAYAKSMYWMTHITTIKLNFMLQKRALPMTSQEPLSIMRVAFHIVALHYIPQSTFKHCNYDIINYSKNTNKEVLS